VPATILEFGDFRLDCDRFELSRAGRTLKLERKPMELLILLAKREGDIVTRTQIAECLWGSEVFVDTEHGINTAIRKVRQVLRDNPDQPRFLHTITGRGYRFVGPVVAVQPALPATNQPFVQSESPAVEPVITTSIPEPSPLVEQGSGAPQRSRIRPWLILGSVAALLLIATAITLRIREHTTHAATPAILSLAVLPLENLSGDSKQDYLADGMTDELTTMLAKDSTLHVVSRTSAMQYKGAHRPLRDIARNLGVDGIVEGSVERSADKVHMTIQLIHASSDTHLWAESYDRDANDVVTLPEEAAQSIAKRLNSTAPTRQPARYINPEAHDAYLHGRYLWFQEQYDKSLPYFKKATELQPDYAPGWAGLSSYYGAGIITGLLDPRTTLPAMDAAARKAVALDDSLPWAHNVLAATYWMYNWDLVRADQEILRAIELDPGFAEAYHLHAKFLGILNRQQEAVAAQKKAMELDPFARPWGLALIYILARQCDAALTDAQQRLESTPNDPGLHEMLSWAYMCKGKQKEAMQEQEQYLVLSGDKASAVGVRHAFEQGGYKAVLRWQIRDMEGKAAKQYVSPYSLATLYAQLGQREKTLALLEETYRQHSPLLFDIQNDPAFDFLHKDERYRSLIQKIGLPPAW
jgi:TolB-like protein/DNA-binding winged helix-turn-helix (wHTH) protein